MMTYPEGTLVKVEIEVRVPKAATYEQIEEWLEFEFHQNGSIKHGNPLIHSEAEPFGAMGFSWEMGTQIGRREEYDHQKLSETRSQYKVRYVREPLVATP